MRYQELIDEYKGLLAQDVKLRQELRQIPNGYLVTKKISGRDYLYLQYSDNGKKKSRYIPAKDAEQVRAAISRREPLKKERDEILKEQHRLEKAADILDGGLSRTMFFLKQSSDMDALPKNSRREALTFSAAITALEGLPARDKVEKELQLWAQGQMSFADIYMGILRKYHVLEEEQ